MTLRLLFAMLVCGALAACEREQRKFQPAPETKTASVRMTQIEPAQAQQTAAIMHPNEENAYAMNQGKRLFRAYNCNGCHSNGGGGMGPALMDDKWIYGSEPQNIYATITQGRPNGMPAFGGHIPEDQVWQLVAYVRSVGGLVRRDAAPGRSDGLYSTEPENMRPRQQPQASSLPQPSKQ